MAFHGAKGRHDKTSISSPVVAESGITVVVGATPVHTVAGNAPAIVYAKTFEEAKQKCGYSDDWAKYSACEAMDAFFRKKKVGPLLIINVLDPTKADAEPTKGEQNIVAGSFELPFEAIKSTLKLQATAGNSAALVEGTDYTAEYSDTALVVSALETGALKEASTCYVEYKQVKSIDKNDIIGGYDGASGQATGTELIDYIFPMYGVVPDIAIAPGFSHIAEVAVALSAKIDTVNTVFTRGHAFVDVDTTVAKVYSDVPKQKKAAAQTAANMYVLWPMAKLGDTIYHASTLAAALTAAHDAEMTDPSESPSNLDIGASAACLEDGTEVYLLLNQANYLNDNGVATLLSWQGKLNLWGDETAAYPTETDPAEYFLNMRRMRGFVANTLILTHWNKVDRNQTRRLIDNVADSASIWLNGLMSVGHLLSAAVSVTADDNPQKEIIAGITKYRVKLGLCGPNKEMDFITEYDPDAVMSALGL